MPQNRPRIIKGMRLLGAIQIMIGLIMHALGLIWTHLLISQIALFGKIYMPFAILSGYPFWSSTFCFISGSFSVAVEKKATRGWLVYTLGMNIVSACISVVGIMLLSLELTIFSLSSPKEHLWPHKSARILSGYLFLFTLLELFVTSIAVDWLYKAKRTT